MTDYFYRQHTTYQQREIYEEMLRILGSLSNLFSESDSPYLASRITENLFCRALAAENLARGDITADAVKDNIGIGIKTWVNSDNQKIAEFNKDRPSYKDLPLEQKIRRISQLRNDRIGFTMRTYALSKMTYHCIIREPGKIIIKECPLIPIDIENIRSVKNSSTSFEFSDGRNLYKFNYSKSTLFKYFDDLEDVKTIDVDIIQDPYSLLYYFSKYEAGTVMEYGSQDLLGARINRHEYKRRYCLPLYSTRGGQKYVPPKNNLNMRFASGRERDIYEVGIPVPAAFSRAHPDFFHPYSDGKSDSYDVILPNGKKLTAKRCQENGKSLMSNPNMEFGHWLIDDVLNIPPETVITYQTLEKYGIDAVYIDEYEYDNGKPYYKINFARCGEYERYMNEIDSENEYD